MIFIRQFLQGFIEETYFYAMYNFLAYLNSFVNPFILLSTGSSFRLELHRLQQRLYSQWTRHERLPGLPSGQSSAGSGGQTTQHLTIHISTTTKTGQSAVLSPLMENPGQIKEQGNHEV